jgi:chromosome segregation protein
LYLKNITLRGFKSFKDRSQLFFEPGISVIVGPNGSGKSNIADAISWVLGEQSPKTLRGNSMADVIFRSKREEMGIAEVSLLFDNSNKLFNTEFCDVKFTRRVFSKGGSEYFINSSPSRLIDIQEMIADSGIGRGLHIIVNQGSINEIALLKPVERRAVMDEVLGISKHKSRRDKSLLKLQKVKDDIDRIDDLMEEIKRTMDPLEVESRRARKYSEILNLLKNEEISLFIANLNNSNSEWDKENDYYIKSKNELEEIKEKTLRLEKEKDNLAKVVSKEQEEYKIWRDKIDWFNSEINNLKNIINLIESKENVFRTLLNMFSIEIENYSQANNKRIDVLKSGSADDLVVFIKKISAGLNEVINLLFAFIESFGKKVKDFSAADYVESEITLIVKKLEALDKSIQKQFKDRESKYSKNKVKEDIKSNVSLEGGINRLKNLKEVCMVNIRKSERANLLMKKYLLISEKISKKLYPEFEKNNSLILKSREKITSLEDEISKFNIRRSRLENGLYKAELKKEQIRERVKTITENIIDNYNMSVDYALKSYGPSDDIKRSEIKVRRLKNEIKDYAGVNPNAAIEYERIKKRFDFLAEQRNDLVDSKKNLEELIKDINKRMSDYFYKKFEEIKKCFSDYFKILFPLGEGEMQLERSDNNWSDNDDEIGVDLKADIGNNKFVSLSLLSGGEKSLVSIAFLFSIYSINPSPFYVFDEVDASLDDVNIGRFLTLMRKFSEKQQIILITHQKRTMEIADTIYGVTMQPEGVSKIISEKIGKKHAEIN